LQYKRHCFLDCLFGFARASIEHGWTEPTLTEDPFDLIIEEGMILGVL